MSRAVNIHIIQYLSVIGSVFLLVFILYLVKNRKIREEYSLLWLFFSIVFIILSFWRQGLEWLSYFIGIDYPPAALFLLLMVAIIFILIQFSVEISGLTEKNKILTQELSLIKMEVKRKNGPK